MRIYKHTTLEQIECVCNDLIVELHDPTILLQNEGRQLLGLPLFYFLEVTLQKIEKVVENFTGSSGNTITTKTSYVHYLEYDEADLKPGYSLQCAHIRDVCCVTCADRWARSSFFFTVTDGSEEGVQTIYYGDALTIEGVAPVYVDVTATDNVKVGLDLTVAGSGMPINIADIGPDNGLYVPGPSLTPGNALTVGVDGGLFLAQSVVSGSGDAGNILTNGSDSGLYLSCPIVNNCVPADTFSQAASGVITHVSNKGISTTARSVSANANNIVVAGSDGGAFLNRCFSTGQGGSNNSFSRCHNSGGGNPINISWGGSNGDFSHYAAEMTNVFSYTNNSGCNQVVFLTFSLAEFHNNVYNLISPGTPINDCRNRYHWNLWINGVLFDGAGFILNNPSRSLTTNPFHPDGTFGNAGAQFLNTGHVSLSALVHCGNGATINCSFNERYTYDRRGGSETSARDDMCMVWRYNWVAIKV